MKSHTRHIRSVTSNTDISIHNLGIRIVRLTYKTKHELIRPPQAWVAYKRSISYSLIPWAEYSISSIYNT